MDPPSTASAAAGGGGGGPAPFLIKTYEMVDDSSTDDIVSWSSSQASFVVWNPPEFAARLLPTYFKHNNFSSFIRQLNTYGFRKIDPERWEFANEEFVKDQKHLLKNIHRRKPIHSHSHPPASAFPEPERMALEEEIDRLSREKTALHANIWRVKQQQSGTKIQLEDLERRLYDMEQRLAKLNSFLQRAVHNPKFVENLIKMAGAEPSSDDFLAIHKKRRLPGVDYGSDAADNSFYDNQSCTSKLEIGQIFNRDFCDKLKLGLCPAAISESNLVSTGTQSSNEKGGSPQREERIGGIEVMECLPLVTDTVELSDTAGTSYCSRKNSMFHGSVDDGDGFISCHLNLTLASTPMLVDRSLSLSQSLNSGDQGPGEVSEPRVSNASRESKDPCTAADSGNEKAAPLQEAMPSSNQGPPAAPGRVNDLFWEQFLTEKPGSSDPEEASSSLRANPCDEQQEERKPGNEGMWRNIMTL